MPHAAQSFALVPHPATPTTAVSGVTARIERTAEERLVLSYRITGNLSAIRIPARRAAGFADNLWRHTCCEAFIKRAGDLAYYEYNFAPSGEWAVYAFRAERERAPTSTNRDELRPHVTVCHGDAQLDLDAVIPLQRLGLAPTDRPALALSAVIEASDGTLSYWALHHPLDKPDFHHPDAFVLELDEVRH